MVAPDATASGLLCQICKEPIDGTKPGHPRSCIVCHGDLVVKRRAHSHKARRDRKQSGRRKARARERRLEKENQ